MPEVSVIIPTFNRAGLLDRAVRSVLSQTHRDFEILVIDDASQDRTQAMVEEKFKPELEAGILRYTRNEKNIERSRTRNKGLEIARGTYINLLDDDDFLFPHHIALLLGYLNSLSAAGIVFSNYLNLHENGFADIGNRGLRTGHGDHYRNLCIRRVLAYNSVHLFRRSVYERLGGFDVNITYGEDREYFSRIAMNYDVGYIDSITGCLYTHSGTNFSRRTLEEHAHFKEQVWQVVEENSKKYSYPLSNETKAEAFLFLSNSFLPNLKKTREHLLKAVGMDYKILCRLNTWGLFFRIIIGSGFYLLLRNIRARWIGKKTTKP